MRKLKLNVDSLKVQTFGIDRSDDLKGTVHANESLLETTGGPGLCPADCGSIPLTCGPYGGGNCTFDPC